MRILINGISARQGGGQTYLLSLLRFFPDHKDLQVILLIPASFELPALSSRIKKLSVPWVEKNPFLRAFWEKFYLPKLLRRWEIDVLYCPGGVISTKTPPRCSTATMFQNMLTFDSVERKRYPWGYVRLRLWLLGFFQGRSFRKADEVIFGSHFGKKVIDERIPRRKGGSAVIPHGLGDHFRVQEGCPFPDDMPREYVLYVSIIDVYKAQLEVVRAWDLLRRRRTTAEKLVLIGPSYPPYARKVRTLIDSLELEEEVLLVGEVPYRELPRYYQHAKINIFASSCENCPHVVLEKMASGRPVFLSDYAPMPEFGRDAVEYFDPYTPQQLTDLLLKYLDAPALREALARKALVEAQEFQWRQAAEKNWDVLIQLASKQHVRNRRIFGEAGALPAGPDEQGDRSSRT